MNWFAIWADGGRNIDDPAYRFKMMIFIGITVILMIISFIFTMRGNKKS